MYVELDSTVFYDTSKVTDANQLKTDVVSSLNSYADSVDLNAFGGRFKYSRAIKVIDDTNYAITSNITNIIIRRNLRALINQYTQYEICYGNQFHVVSEGFNIKSTGFTVEGSSEVVFFTDVPNMGYKTGVISCLLYTSPSPRDYAASRMPSSA